MKIILQHLIVFLIISSCKSIPSRNIDSKKVRIIEEYGGTCCPRGFRYGGNHIRSFIAKFERENNVDIKDTYFTILGKEGEAIYYLTLNGLNSNQRKKFFEERYSIWPKMKKEKLGMLKNPIKFKNLKVSIKN